MSLKESNTSKDCFTLTTCKIETLLNITKLLAAPKCVTVLRFPNSLHHFASVQFYIFIYSGSVVTGFSFLFTKVRKDKKPQVSAANSLFVAVVAMQDAEMKRTHTTHCYSIRSNL